MKRFKRPISEVAKGMFHGGSEGPIIPNLGVNSKKPTPLKKSLDIENSDGGSVNEQTAKLHDKPKAKSDPYADAAKKDPKLGEYVKARKGLKKGTPEWNANQNKINAAYGVKKRYDEGTTTKVEDKPKVEDKAKVEDPKVEDTPKVEKTKAEKITQKADEKVDKITTRGDKKVERIKARKAKRAERKESRVENKAARQEGRAAKKEARQDRRAKVKAARNA